jgi:hypothetical protein
MNPLYLKTTHAPVKNLHVLYEYVGIHRLFSCLYIICRNGWPCNTLLACILYVDALSGHCYSVVCFALDIPGSIPDTT